MSEQLTNTTVPHVAVAELGHEQTTTPLAAAAMDLTGQNLNHRYRLGRLLSKGVLGDVYMAYDRIENRPCSLKLVHHRLSNAFYLHQRLAHEARIVSRLSHHNIIEGYAFDLDDEGNFLFVMEPLDGVDLQNLLTESGVLPLTRVLQILGAVGAALQYLHDLGIVHQDINPRSIFLKQEYNRSTREAIEVIKLWNFGLARQRLPGSYGVDYSQRWGLGDGPSVYLSPESLESGGDEVDARSDQWSLAVLAYQMLTGKLPPQEDDLCPKEMATEDPILEELKLVNPELPGRMALAIKKALSKDKKERFVAVRDFISALDSTLLICQKPTREISFDELIEKSRPEESLQEAVPVPVEIEQTTRKYPTLSLPGLLLESVVCEPHRESPQGLAAPWGWRSVISRRRWLWGGVALILASGAVHLSLQHLWHSSLAQEQAQAQVLTEPVAMLPAPLPPVIVEQLVRQDAPARAPSLTAPPPPAPPKRQKEGLPPGDGSSRRLTRWTLKGARFSDEEKKDPEVENGLVNAQTAYVNGNYQEAVAIARSLQNHSPSRSWRIIGASACFMKDGALVRDASRHLRSDDTAQRFMSYVCKLNGMTMSGNPLKPSG